jgi:hypothetical protein
LRAAYKNSRLKGLLADTEFRRRVSSLVDKLIDKQLPAGGPHHGRASRRARGRK